MKLTGIENSLELRRCRNKGRDSIFEYAYLYKEQFERYHPAGVDFGQCFRRGLAGIAVTLA